MVKRLLKAHGLAETERRMGIMFDWPDGTYPVTTAPTLALLSQHIDTFVALPAKKGASPGLSAKELWDRAEALEALEKGTLS